MPTITIELTDAEMRALAYAAVDPVEWASNFTKVRCQAAMQEIYDNEVRRMLEDPNISTIPADRDLVVRQASIKSAAESGIVTDLPFRGG